MKSIISDIKKVVFEFDPISLLEMDSVALMNRFDYKYAFNIKRLPTILSLVRDKYNVLEIDGIRGFNYKSIYFDTDDLTMYHDHHNGKPIRYKIRRREYVDSGLNFMEIKQKDGQGKTLKERIIKHKSEHHFTDLTNTFIHNRCPFVTCNLNAQLINYFVRYTLVHKTESERLTIDVCLNFSYDNREFEIPFLVIAEVKREGETYNSTFMKLMREMSIRQSGMSKYCIGTIFLNPKIKKNSFKPNLLNLKRIENDAFRD